MFSYRVLKKRPICDIEIGRKFGTFWNTLSMFGFDFQELEWFVQFLVSYKSLKKFSRDIEIR